MEEEPRFTLDDYDATPLHDAATLATAITRFMARRGAEPAIGQERMARRICNYVRACQEWGVLNVATPAYSTDYPADWTTADEVLWRGWMHSTFLPWEWEEEVMRPVFGSDVRSWEPAGWREGLFEIALRGWLLRRLDIVERYDPSPRLTVAEKERLAEEARIQEAMATQDPYLADQERRRRRR